MIFPVVLSGGSGSRLWPLSRTLLPKQFLPLVSDKTMLQETLLRLDGVAGLKDPVLVCSNDHRFLAAEQLREIGLKTGAQILEPAGRNTAPAVAVAALHVLSVDPDGVMLVLPADHLIRNVVRFHEVIGKAAAVASVGRLVTFGIVGREPETGYGYIERGEQVEDSSDCYRVARFVEKPDEARAREFLASGRFYWNSGMFVFKASRYLAELGKYRKDILDAAKAAWAASSRDLDFVRLGEKAFLASPSESIDYAVMEKPMTPWWSKRISGGAISDRGRRCARPGSRMPRAM